MIRSAKNRWDSQRKAHEGDTVIFSDKPKVERFTKDHVGHKGKVIDSRYRTGATGLSIKRMYLINCEQCDQQDWIISASFTKA